VGVLGVVRPARAAVAGDALEAEPELDGVVVLIGHLQPECLGVEGGERRRVGAVEDDRGESANTRE
jgi:hypothetical protein